MVPSRSVNFDALRCDFSKFNHTLLLSWQHWRGEFTRQRKLLNYKSFDDMRRRCFTAGNVRAVPAPPASCVRTHTTH